MSYGSILVVAWLRVDFDKQLLPTRTRVRPRTPLVVELGGNSKPIEEIQEGDWVLALSEFDPQGLLELNHIEEK